MSRFKGRIAIVTGAAIGIGKEIAIRLAAEGGSPVIAEDPNLDELVAAKTDVDFVQYLRRKAPVPDDDHRVQVVGTGFQMPAFKWGE